MKIRDYQRTRVYRLDDDLAAARPEKLTLAECKTLADKAVNAYIKTFRFPWANPSDILVKDGRGRRSCCAIKSNMEIRMTVHGRTPVILMHEVAHLLTPRDVAAHGAEYMAIYLWLLVKFVKFDAKNVRECAEARGVKIAPLTQLK